MIGEVFIIQSFICSKEQVFSLSTLLRLLVVFVFAIRKEMFCAPEMKKRKIVQVKLRCWRQPCLPTDWYCTTFLGCVAWTACFVTGLDKNLWCHMFVGVYT